MKYNLLFLLLPILIFTASCTSTQQVQSGIVDDVYYSSKDRAAERETARASEKSSTAGKQETLAGKQNRRQAYSGSRPVEKKYEKRRERAAGDELVRPVARALVEIALWTIFWHHSWNWSPVCIQF